MRYLTLFVLLSFSATTWCNSFDQEYINWNAYLKKYVVKKGPQTLVKYFEARKSPNELDKILKAFSALPKTEFDKFSKDQQLAFLINVYNAFTIKLIIMNKPVKSIKDLGSFFSSPWKKKFFKIFGREVNLDDIEHDMIRQWYQEPRIHMAVNCASIGCPSLAMKAFTGSNLNSLLDEMSTNFMNNPTKNKFDEKTKTLYLSKIFSWYGDDWKKHKDYGSVHSFAAKYMNVEMQIKENISKKKYEVEYLDYDWNLNKAD